MKCYVGECLRYGEKKVTKAKKVVLVMATLVVTQMLVGKKNNIHHWMWLSCIPNLVFLTSCQDGYNPKLNKSKMAKPIKLCCRI